jgi:hypothetical protein
VTLAREEEVLPQQKVAAVAAVQEQRDERGEAQAVVAEQVTASSALLDTRIWFERSPWRIAGGWSMVAALLALGLPMQMEMISLPTLVLLFLLVDLFWGSIWGSMTFPNSLPAVERSLRQTRIWLPYLRAGSPAARLFGYDSPGILPLILRVALPGILVALLVAAVLDTTIFWLTLVVVLLSMGGWLHQQVPLVPVIALHSMVSVTLPWWATFHSMGIAVDQEWKYGALIVLWSVHFWGSQHNLVQANQRGGLIGIAIAQAGISMLLILAQMPIWLAILAILWLPTWLAVYTGQPLRRVEIWWLPAMLISALAIGQSLMP